MPGSTRELLTPATRMGVSIAIATGLYGVSFGALSIAAGLDLWQTVALSAIMFTGGSQFAFIGVIAGGGTGAAAFTAASLLGVRNAVYGMQIKQTLRPRARQVPMMAHVTIDESTATSLSQNSLAERARGFWTAGLGVFILWNLFTLVGALLGESLGDPAAWGLDGAAVAAFLGLLWPRLKGMEPIMIALAAGVVTALAVPLTAPGMPILIAAAAAVLYAVLSAKRGEQATEHGKRQEIDGGMQ
ncbi:AzlC family ABC transporter permease [Glutamicibacter sp. MNS18]|uniref:AzlC family ABC transporter permease n=1 Tax=Glutamicibacter sp. MNS18 TaxID=2989817 RepID=UPI0022356E5E|nr:AzlC family ABC transporter permease [Glutamicibacter sp. MNS18]MCW4466044.1 AzlC family ABC transporter permease [Glutamicibacter sp. MNS18]